MKWIFALLLFVSAAAIGQSDDNDKYIWYKFQYGSRMPRFWADSVLKAAGLVKFTGLVTKTDTTTNKPIVIDASGNVHKMVGWPGLGSGGGISYIYSATEPTGSDTAKLWIKTPAVMGVYDLYTYATYQFSWVRYAWLSVDGFLSFLPPLNMVVAGQSNAAGIFSGGDTARIRGLIGYSSGAINGGIDNPTTWQPTYIGLSPFYSNSNNVAHAFAKEVVKKERRIVRVIAAYEGGTGIGRWNGRETFGPKTPTYLLDTLRQRLDRSGIDTVHVFLWLHGESAYPTSDVTGGYYSDFKCFEDSLYSPLTKGVHRNFTNIISCDMATDTSTTAMHSGASPQGAMRRLLEDNDPYTSFAPAYGLSLCDPVHFCGTSLDSLGRRAFGAFKQMPRNIVDEEPKYTYDYVNNKKAFTTRIKDYVNGITATNINGVTLGWMNNTGGLFNINGSTGLVGVGSSTGYNTSSGDVRLSVNGNAIIAGSGYNVILAGNMNVTGSLEHDVIIGNYPSDFTGSSGGNETVGVGFNVMYNTNGYIPYNSTVVGSNAGTVGPANYISDFGFESGNGAAGQFHSYFGYQSGKNTNGTRLSAFGKNTGAINTSSYSHSTAIGAEAKFDADSQFVNGDKLKEFVIDGINYRHKFDLTGTPSTGQAFVFNGTKFVLTSVSGADGNGIYGGNGSLPSNVTVTGANNSITFDDIFAFRVNSDYNVIAKANGTGIYSEAVIGAGNIYEIGFTPVAGVFSKGAGVFIDTNVNVGIGTQPPTAMPLYATGASLFVQGLQSNAGNFNRVDNLTTTGNIGLTSYFITVDATAGNVVLTLPAASTAFGNLMGIKYKFQRIDASGNTVTIQRAGSDTINGGTSFTLTTQYTEIKEIQCTSASTWAQN